MLTLKGRTCVFAGATGNIGRGAIRALAEGGMNVVLVTHNPDSAKEIIESLKDCSGKVVALSNENGDAAVFPEVEKLFGSIDVVINTTGGFDAVKPLEDVTGEELDKKLHHQVTSVFGMMQAAVPYLKKSTAGRIILMTSAGAVDGFTGENIVDSIARGGVITMTYAMAKLLSSDKITVNCIARSGMINDHEPHRPTDYDSATVLDRIPAGHLGTTDEFGALVSYIASEEGGFITGQVYQLNGGIHIG